MAMLTLTVSAGLSIAQDKASEFRNHFDQGKVLFAAGKFAEAATEFETAHTINVTEPVTQKNLALCYMKL